MTELVKLRLVFNLKKQSHFGGPGVQILGKGLSPDELKLVA